MESWLKNYFSLFFNTREFGSLLWLVIPFSLYFLLTLKKRSRGEKAVAFAVFVSYISLSIRGRAYPRYLFTLYPFLLAAVFFYGRESLKNKSRVLQGTILFLCGVLICLNFYLNREPYRFLWRYKISAAADFYPHELLKFIRGTDEINAKNIVLVCSPRHLFFYYAEKKGIDFRDPKMEIFFRADNKDKALEILKNTLAIKYILVYWAFNPGPILKEIIENDAELIIQEQAEGLKLYRLKDRELTQEEVEEIFVNDSLLKNGSFENWSRGDSAPPDFFDSSDNVLPGMVSREESVVRAGKSSAKITGDNFNFGQSLSNIDNYRGKPITCFAWVKTRVPGKYQVEINDGLNSSVSGHHSGSGRWQLLQANHTISPSAKTVIVRIIQAERTGKTDDVVYVDGALLLEGNWNTFFLYRRSYFPSVREDKTP